MAYRPPSNSDGESSSSGSTEEAPRERRGVWTDEEHKRFLVATSLFPGGPWRAIADYVGTRTTRQVMTHAHKLLQRQARHERGLKPPGRVPTPNSRRRRRRSRRREVTEPYALAEIPVDRELEMLFAPPPTQPVPGSVTGSLTCDFKALHVDAANDTPSGSDDEAKDEYVEGISSVSVWLGEFLRSVELSDLEADEEEETNVQA